MLHNAEYKTKTRHSCVSFLLFIQQSILNELTYSHEIWHKSNLMYYKFKKNKFCRYFKSNSKVILILHITTVGTKYDR